MSDSIQPTCAAAKQRSLNEVIHMTHVLASANEQRISEIYVLLEQRLKGGSNAQSPDDINDFGPGLIPMAIDTHDLEQSTACILDRVVQLIEELL